MSTVKKYWEQVDEIKTGPKSKDESLANFYETQFGRYFSNGLNIGREITEKLSEGNYTDVWPTLLQEEGLDSGLTAGFLTACGICPIDLGENTLEHLPDVMRKMYRTEISLEIISTDEDLEKYPSYTHYPEEQQWSLPAIMIRYVPIPNVS